LEGLKIYVTHIKEALIPHPTGKSARERISKELEDLEEEGKLGVTFIAVQRGDRICTYISTDLRFADENSDITYAYLSCSC
jgi:hypothetical protein